MKRSEMVKLMVEAGDSEFVLTLEQIADRMLASCEEVACYLLTMETVELFLKMFNIL